VDTLKREIKYIGEHSEDRDNIYRWTLKIEIKLTVDTLKIEIKFIGGHPEDRDKIYRWTL
jgi:hypothetical protein